MRATDPVHNFQTEVGGADKAGEYPAHHCPVNARWHHKQELITLTLDRRGFCTVP